MALSPELESKEDQLKVYLRDLERLGDFDDETAYQNDSFSILKEKAFEILIKAQQLNEEIEHEMKKISLTSEKQILDKLDCLTREKSILNLKDEFEINIESLKRKKRLKTDDFVGLESYKGYLESLWDYFSREQNWSGNNALIYGPSGCGKVTYLFNSLYENGLLKSIDETTMSKVKVFFIDFKHILSRSNVEIDFFERLFDSINAYVHGLTLGLVLVVVKNLEFIFESERFEELRYRFMADLIYNMEINEPGSGAESLKSQKIRFHKLIFILISTQPWLFPIGFNHQFKTVIKCGFLSPADIDMCADMCLKKSLESLKTDWLLSNWIEKFLNESDFDKKLKSQLKNTQLTPKIIVKLIQATLELIKGKIHEKFQEALSAKDLDLDEYEELKLEFRDSEKRRQTLRRNSARYWKNVQSRLFAPSGSFGSDSKRKRSSFRKESVSSVLSGGQRKRSSVSKSNGGSQSSEITYNSLRDDIWKSEAALNLTNIAIDNLNKLITINSFSPEFVKNHENFNRLLDY